LIVWLLPFLSQLSTVAARTFYRIEIVGPEVPRSGPVLLVANHPNSLLDPALVAAAADRSVRFLAKSTLFSDPRVGWLVRGSGAIPVYRRSDDPAAAAHNIDMFEAVFQALAHGAAVGIFPEGISHSQPALAQLRTGSARIALGACARHGAMFPLIPVGLLLREKGVFRSEALVIRGETVSWEDLAGRDVEDQEAVRDLTHRLESALRAVTVNLEHWEDSPLIDCAAAVWSAEMGEEGDRIEQLKRSQTAAGVLADLRRQGDGRWVELARDVDLHRRRLHRLGLTPADLDAQIDLATGARWTLRRLHLFGPPAIVLAFMGALLFWVPFHLTDGIIALIQPEEDQRSTYKILIGALAYFCWILSLAALSGWYWGGWTALAVVVVLPLWGLAGQWVRERWRGAWGDARRFFLLRSRQDLRSQLKEDQRNLANRLHQAFEAWRVPHKPVD
jgi:glycerol-3-phosphate O-acyltransferase/dihydroxyacetone phosphate acyltransferase